MQIGALYKIKKIWFLYPQKDFFKDKKSRSVARTKIPSFAIMESLGISKHFGCEINCIFEDTMIVAIDSEKSSSCERAKLYKILTTDGQSGWIKIDDYNRTCFSLKV